MSGPHAGSPTATRTMHDASLSSSVLSPALHRLAWAAASLTFASAAVTLLWTLGGTLLLDTVGGAPEELAREHSLGSVALGFALVLLKVSVGLLALALLRRDVGSLRRRGLVLVNAAASVLLVSWGAVSILVGALVLSGVITPTGSVDERSQYWHVFFWDPWFVVWGALLALAVARYRRETS